MNKRTGEFRSLPEVLEEMNLEEDLEWDRLQNLARLMTESVTDEEVVRPDIG